MTLSILVILLRSRVYVVKCHAVFLYRRNDTCTTPWNEQLFTRQEMKIKPLAVESVFWHRYALFLFAVSGRIPLNSGYFGYIRSNR